MRRAVVPTLILLELLACVGDLLLGPFGRVHWEERFNARAGVQLSCGHWEAIADLQYVSFCGGCTGEALLAVPLFELLGPTVLAWKLVPLAFHGVVLAAGGWLATRASGPRGGATFVALMAAAPGFYRELVLTGWGNHVESAAFPLAAAVLIGSARRRRLPVRVLLVAMAGFVAGLGAWFCHTSTWALPALAVGALWVAPPALPLFLGAAWLGFQPYQLYLEARPDQAERTVGWALNLHLAPMSRLWDWLFGPYLRWGLWDPADHGEGSPLRGAWWWGFWGLGGLGLAGALLRRGGGGDPQARMARLFPAVGLLTLLAAYAVRFDLWAHLPEVPSQPTLGLRYRAPLVPLLALGAALAVGRRAGLAWGLLPLVLFGLGMRTALWTEVHAELPGLSVYGHDGWRDRSVPVGAPPQRLVRKQGRPQDVRAALAFLDDHRDPWPDCGWDHAFELGRRVGLGLDAPGGPPPDWQSLEALADDPITARMVADGVAKVLVDAGGADLDAAAGRLSALPAPWAEAVGRAIGRRVSAHVEASPVAAVQVGICEGRGQRSGVALGVEAATCARPAAWAWGAGFAQARDRGCGRDDGASLAAAFASPDALQAAEDGWRQGCAQLRVDAGDRLPAPLVSPGP